DAQGVATAVVNPQSVLVIEEALHESPAALYGVFDAYHRWQDDDWGFARDDRIICPAPVSFVDPVLAEKQLQWLLEHGVKVVVFRPGPVVGPWGVSRTPADPIYDRCWSMIEEAGVVAAYHVADGNSKKYLADWSDGAEALNYEILFNKFASIVSIYMERAI